MRFPFINLHMDTVRRNCGLGTGRGAMCLEHMVGGCMTLWMVYFIHSMEYTECCTVSELTEKQAINTSSNYTF